MTMDIREKRKRYARYIKRPSGKVEHLRKPTLGWLIPKEGLKVGILTYANRGNFFKKNYRLMVSGPE